MAYIITSTNLVEVFYLYRKIALQIMNSSVYTDLLDAFNHTTDPYIRIDLLNEIALEIRNDDVDRALIMAEEIIEQSQALNYQSGIGNGMNHKGACYWIMGEYEDGLDELTGAYAIAKSINDPVLEAKVLNNFGRIYRSLGNLANALQNFEEALEINERNGNELLLTINLTNISNLYHDLGDYDTALEYALKCLPIFEKYQNITRLLDIYNTLGDIYFKKEIFQKSLEYFQTNLKLAEADSVYKCLAICGIGKVEFKQRNYEGAEHYLQQAMVEADKIDNVESQIISNYYYGQLTLAQSNYRLALLHLEKAYDLAQDTSRRHDLMSIHESLSAIYDLMGNIPKAFNHLKAFEKLKEEIFQQATLNKLRNLQIKNQIEVAKKEKEVAERTASLKQQFMANMSHEIRTPMNAIVGITRLLMEKNPREDQVKYLNAIQQSSDNLLIIINDILDFSKIEAGKIIIEHFPFSLRNIISNIQEMMEIKAVEKSLDLEFWVEDEIPDQLKGDSTRVTQILVNLIGNALKFTEKGKVSLKIENEGIKNNSIQLKFSIEDTGIGISKEYVESIFESFTQAGTDTARKYGGTGLGLTISKQLVDLMDGKIYVESQPNVGTTFYVEICFVIAKNQNSIKKEEDGVSKELMSRLNNSKVLLVEDNEFNQLVAEDTLRDLLPDIELKIADNGAIAVEMMEAEDYDIILMDIQMPVMNGVEATKAIRSMPIKHKANTSIIAMTANVLQEDVQAYLNAGMNAYMSKPFKPEDLLNKMVSVLPDKLVRENLSPTKNSTSENAANENIDVALNNTQVPNTEKIKMNMLPEQITDMNFLKQFTNDNIAKIDKYISMYIQNAPGLLKKINDTWTNKDMENLKVAAHSLKPQLSYMGVREEVSHIYELEQAAAQRSNNEERMNYLISNIHDVVQQSIQELSKNV